MNPDKKVSMGETGTVARYLLAIVAPIKEGLRV